MNSRELFLLFGFGLFAASSAACGQIVTTEHTDEARAPIGKADLVGSCSAGPARDSCGGKSDGNCWCDDLCDAYGDCCSDKCLTCEPDGACQSDCPDPNDPKVHYIDQDPNKCAVLRFACEAGQTLFTDACGCGCIDSEPSCPDPNDPKVHYIDEDQAQCAAIFFGCEAGQTLFTDACGCGCIDSEPSCPDPNDAKVHYLSQEPGKCAAMLFTCEAGQTLFTDACGCGCIDS